VKAVLESTKDGVDVAIEAVGVPQTFDVCQSIVRPGGHVANIGVHGSPVQLQIQKLWIQNITLTTGLVNTNTTPMLLKTVQSGKLQPGHLVTHRFTFDKFMDAYDVFGNAAKTKALKVVISKE
jgi:alcohol dehydrogenase